MNDDRLPKIVFSANHLGTNKKGGRPRMKWKEVTRKDLKEVGYLQRV